VVRNGVAVIVACGKKRSHQGMYEAMDYVPEPRTGGWWPERRGSCTVWYHRPPGLEQRVNRQERAAQEDYSPWCVEEKFCELRVDGVLGSWSGRSCNVFDFLVSNSSARAFVESNQAAKQPLQEKGQHVGLGNLGFAFSDARMPRPMGGHRCRSVALCRCAGRSCDALHGAVH
jgi:hypothetical protein